MTFTQDDKKRNILCLQYLNFINCGYFFLIPVIVDYTKTYSDAGPEGYFYIITIANIVGILFSLLLGAYSDLHSRKTLLVFNSICRLSCWSIFIIFPNYWAFLIGFILFVIGNLSSNPSSCLYETMEAADDKDDYRHQEQAMQTFTQYGLMIGLPISGYLYSIDHSWPFILTIATQVIGIGVALIYKEAPRVKSTHVSMIAFLKETLLFIKNTHRLRWIILYRGIIAAAILMIIFVFQAVFLELGGSATQFAYLTILIYGARGLGAQLTTKLFNKVQNHAYALGIILILTTFFMLVCGFKGGMILFCAMTFFSMIFRGMQMPAFNIVYNEIINSDIRATVYNTTNLWRRVNSIIFNLITGVGIAHIGASNTMIVIAAYMLIIGGTLLWLFHQSVKEHERLER